MIYSFENDYSETACPEVMEALAKASGEQYPGYGNDTRCSKAAELIRNEIRRPDADIHFVSGGTQINTLALASMLKPYQAVIAALTGHILVHETGAIEATGHRIISMPEHNGKLIPADIRKAALEFTGEHMVQPHAIYISQTTEIGSVYSKDELAAIREAANEFGFLLYIDGARLGSALTSGKGITIHDIVSVADAFTIGGTKNGLLFGEAYVILNDAVKQDFRYMTKRHGALTAKGFALGIQFEAAFTNGVFYKNATHANEMAHSLANVFKKHGIAFASEPESNQLFVYLSDEVRDRLMRDFAFQFSATDERGSIYRFVTSWATPESAVNAVDEAL